MVLCGSKLMKAPWLGYFDTQGGSKYQVQSLKSLGVNIQLRDFLQSSSVVLCIMPFTV